MAFEVFQGFYAKVHQILGFSEPQVVIPALVSLADGDRATVPGAIIEPLSGLGEQNPMPSDNEPYRAAMRELLEWGLRHFPIRTRSRGVRLWSTMAIFDGHRGYNQKLVRNPGIATPIYFPAAEPEGKSTVVDNSILPTIITERTNVPVQRFDGDSATIVNFMKQDVDVQTVLATSSLFGWENLSTQCDILYVDGNQSSEESLATLFAGSEIPSIIIGCKLRDLAGGMDEARELVYPPGMNSSETSKREFALWENQPLRAPVSVSPFWHGQSLSLKGEESKGSVGVFLTPTGEKEESYALTASHVFPVTGSESTKDIITPGGLDILSALYSILETEQTETEKSNFLLTRFKERCGTLFSSHIGARENGWRSDWALVRLDPEWQGMNTRFYNENRMVKAFRLAKREGVDPSFSGKGAVLNRRDPMGGEACCKDGASTGTTSGVIGQTEAQLFRRGTADIADENEDPHNIEKCSFLLMNPLMASDGLDPISLGDICRRGDSGSAVFCADEKNNGWVWVGQLTSLMNSDDTRTVGLVIPQSEVLASIEEVTGTAWHLTSRKNCG